MREMRRLPLLTVGLVALAAACAAPPPPAPVSVQGSPADLATLAGEWSGDYFSADTGRSGSIRLDLRAEEGMAHGDVMMFARQGEPMTPAHEHSAEAGRVSTQALSIRFVAVEGDLISGTIEPYRDPGCAQCVVSTTFTGRLRGDVIEGSYVTHGGPGHRTQQGRWRVERKKG